VSPAALRKTPIWSVPSNVLIRGLVQLESKGPDLARIACEVNGTPMPSAAGTHQSDMGEA
jgi:hypothetical protein